MTVELEYYARALLEKVRVLRNETFTSKQHRAHFVSATQYDVRWLSKMFPIHASQAALDLCEGKIDLFALRWDDQPKAELLLGSQGRVKGLLHHEHKTPISDVVAEMVKHDDTVEAIVARLRAMEIVWILKSENKKLPVSKRVDHDAAYEKVGIKVVRSTYGSTWYEKPWRS